MTPVNAPVIRSITLGTTYQPLAAERLVGTFTIRNHAAGTASLLCDDGVTEFDMDRNQQLTLEGVDLSQIQAKGTLGDYLLVSGFTRTV